MDDNARGLSVCGCAFNALVQVSLARETYSQQSLHEQLSVTGLCPDGVNVAVGPHSCSRCLLVTNRWASCERKDLHPPAPVRRSRRSPDDRWMEHEASVAPMNCLGLLLRQGRSHRGRNWHRFGWWPLETRLDAAASMGASSLVAWQLVPVLRLRGLCIESGPRLVRERCARTGAVLLHTWRQTIPASEQEVFFEGQPLRENLDEPTPHPVTYTSRQSQCFLLICNHNLAQPLEPSSGSLGAFVPFERGLRSTQGSASQIAWPEGCMLDTHEHFAGTVRFSLGGMRHRPPLLRIDGVVVRSFWTTW